MEETRDLQKVLNWLRRQELKNAHVVSVLEGRHTPQFAALKRILDGRSINDVGKLQHSFRMYVDSSNRPDLLLVIWDSEACEQWQSPPRRIVEVIGSPKAGLSCMEGPVIDAISDEFELCMVTNDPPVRDWIGSHCSPIAWHSNVVYTIDKFRYRPKREVPVRPLSARDEKAVADFVTRAGPDEHGSTQGQFELAKRGLFYKSYGTFSRDQLTGYLTLFERTTNVWEVLWVRVDAGFRGKGIGSALVSRATDDILTAGKIAMYLTTPSNITALSMVSDLGFFFAYSRYTAQITEMR